MAENYPQLKSDETFKQLQARITALEESIADRREFYNDQVNLNNIRVKIFPDVMIARRFGFLPAHLLEFAAEEKARHRRRRAVQGLSLGLARNTPTGASSPDMSGNHLRYLLLLFGFAATATYSFWYGFKAWRENRMVEDTPSSRVRSAAQGYVELTGHGVAGPGHESHGPLTRKPCTWWRYKIEERSSTGRSRGWSTVDSGTSESPFILDDGTGQCLIDPRGAEVFPAAKDVWYGATVWPEVRIPDGQGLFGKLADLLLSGGDTDTPNTACSPGSRFVRSAHSAVSAVPVSRARIARWRNCCANGNRIKRRSSSASTAITTASLTPGSGIRRARPRTGKSSTAW